jgi:hypothetical protein
MSASSVATVVYNCGSIEGDDGGTSTASPEGERLLV